MRMQASMCLQSSLNSNLHYRHTDLLACFAKFFFMFSMTRHFQIAAVLSGSDFIISYNLQQPQEYKLVILQNDWTILKAQGCNCHGSHVHGILPAQAASLLK